MINEVVALHVHVEVSTHEDGDVLVVVSQGGDEGEELLDIISPVQECGVIVLAMPRHGDEAWINILKPNSLCAVKLQKYF